MSPSFSFENGTVDNHGQNAFFCDKSAKQLESLLKEREGNPGATKLMEFVIVVGFHH